MGVLRVRASSVERPKGSEMDGWRGEQYDEEDVSVKQLT